MVCNNNNKLEDLLILNLHNNLLTNNNLLFNIINNLPHLHKIKITCIKIWGIIKFQIIIIIININE